MSNFFDTSDTSKQENLFRATTSYFPTTSFEGYTASFKTGFRNNITNLAVDKIDSIAGKFDDNEDAILEATEANAEFGPLTPFDKPIRRVDARIRSNRERFLVQQQAIQNQSGIGGFSAGVAQFVGGVADPLMWASTAALGGVAVGALNAARAGSFVKIARGLESIQGLTTGSAIAAELTENLALAAVLEIPLAESLENVYGQEFTTEEHAYNIIVGTVAGTFFRYVGRAYTHLKGKPSSIDKPRTDKIVIQELFDAEARGQAPDFEAAQKRDRAGVVERVNSIAHEQRTAKTFESDGTSGTYYTTHRVGGEDLTKSQVRMGSSFGDGLYMANKSSLAEAKGLHIPETEIVKFQVDNLKLIDIEAEVNPSAKLSDIDNVDVDTKLYLEFKDYLAGILPNARALKDVSEQTNIKGILKVLDEFAEQNPDLFIQNRANAFFAEKGFDGYRFAEDFFEGDVGQALFVFRASKELDDAFVSRHMSDETNRGETTVTPDVTDSPNVGPDADTKLNAFENDPIYGEDPEIVNQLVEAFDPNVLKTPDVTSKEGVEQIGLELEDIEAVAKQEKIGVEEPVETKLDRDLKVGKKQISDAEEAAKAAIVCGRRNS